MSKPQTPTTLTLKKIGQTTIIILLSFGGVFSVNATNTTCFGNLPVFAQYANIYSNNLSQKQFESLYQSLSKWHQTQFITVFDCHVSASNRASAKNTSPKGLLPKKLPQKKRGPHYKSPFKLQHTGCQGRQNRIELFANQYTTIPVAHYQLSKQGQLLCPTIETSCINYTQP
jgi:hypothetical protein